MGELPPEAQPLKGDVLLPEEYLEKRRDIWAAHKDGRLTAEQLTDELMRLTEENPDMTAADIHNMLEQL